MKKNFKRHLRIYLKNNHPAYIVDENADDYVFHRTSHNKRISGKKTFEIKNNPIRNNYLPMFIAKNKQIDKKNKFSILELKIKKGIDISYPFIDSELNKKTPAGQTNKGHPTTARSKTIKSNKK